MCQLPLLHAKEKSVCNTLQLCRKSFPSVCPMLRDVLGALLTKHSQALAARLGSTATTPPRIYSSLTALSQNTKFLGLSSTTEIDQYAQEQGKGIAPFWFLLLEIPHTHSKSTPSAGCSLTDSSQGGKNRRRGKNENDNEKRELTFKEEGQGKSFS